MVDAIGDEEGVYPLASEYTNQSQLFDLTSFEVHATNNSVLEFSFHFYNLTNPKNGTFGFTYPQIQVYIHTTPPGSWRVFKEGTSVTLGNSNIRIDDSYTWKRMLHLNGWNAVIYNEELRESNIESFIVRTEENTISAILQNHSLGFPTSEWSFTVLIGAYNFRSTDETNSFAEFQAEPSEYSFGGGDDGDFDPNIIDILVPPNAAWTQKHRLYNYCTREQMKTTIPPVSSSQIPYLRSQNSYTPIARETGGIGCVDSSYQTSPTDRYRVKSNNGENQWTLEYNLDESDLDEYGVDDNNVRVRIEEISNCIFRLVIEDMDGDRFQLPKIRDDEVEMACGNGEKMYEWSVHESPFGVQVKRKENSEEIFNSHPSGNHNFRNLVFKEKYLEFTTRLPDETDIFGLGERISSLRLDKDNHVYSIFNVDQGTPQDKNLYGSHPFYMEMREQHSHGVFMANSLGMDVVVAKNRLTYKLTGGIIDLYIFMGPTVDDVTKQYQSIIGKPALPPYWALGYHQSRWGYKNVQELQAVVDKFTEHDLPLDTMWSDIDYMDEHKLWTLDPVNYPASTLRDFVDTLHEFGQHYVIIVDPGVKIEEGYEPYETGLERGIFIQDHTGTEPAVGKVWPGFVSFVDFFHPDAGDYWTEQFQIFFETIPFDGLWTDMNEIASFCDGHCVLSSHRSSVSESLFECICDEPEYNELDFPPYFVGGMAPDTSTISMASQHYNGTSEYYLHNLYGYLEGRATKQTLEQLTHQRSFVLTRSSFAGSGHYVAHWLGDNTATWEDMYQSIPGIINMNLFGIPLVGADVCGFNANTTGDLCARWMQLGAFYPFYRNHNGIENSPQEPYVFGKTVTDLSRAALRLRYSLITYYYSKLIEISRDGGTLIDGLGFIYPWDKTARSIDTQFMVGKSLMVAPVLQESALEHSVYFPIDKWYNFFSGEMVFADSMIENVTTKEEGKWVQFDNVYLDDIFVFMKGGSIVFSQVPGMNSNETRHNPMNIVVAMPSAGNQATGNLIIDDGISLDSASSEWSVTAELKDSVGNITFTMKANDYIIDGFMLNNFTVYGVPPPCTIVLLNGSRELDFAYDSKIRTLQISMDNQSMYGSFKILWGKKQPKQTVIERGFILVGSLMFTVSLLSIVTLIIFGIRKKYPCNLPVWLRIPRIREVAEYRPANTEEDLIETEMEVFESNVEEELICNGFLLPN